MGENCIQIEEQISSFLFILFSAPDRTGKRLTSSTHLLQYSAMTWWLVFASKSHLSLPPRSRGPAFAHRITCEHRQTPKNRQRTLVHERGSTATCSWVLASCITILQLQKNLVLYMLLGSFELPLTLDSGTGKTLTLTSPVEMPAGNDSWFSKCQSWGGNWELHFWLFWAWSNGQN